MLYWVTNTWGFGAAVLLVHRARPGRARAGAQPVWCRCPPAWACFPGEVFYVPRKFAARDSNLVHWSPQPAGGHFAACEQPELFVEDLRAFARKVRH